MIFVINDVVNFDEYIMVNKKLRPAGIEPAT
mgnify:FL=1